MSTVTPPQPQPRPQPVNSIGQPMSAYKGADSTLCAGCGHDSVTSQIIKALFETGVSPYNIAKLSGIGCSSKATAYFCGQSHGFNGVHGRMAAMATGCYAANRTLLHVGVSGDGDTASIGLGNFLHTIRRNVPVLYIVANNGVYGLTKGQLSATADKGACSRKGYPSEMRPIDCCALAIQMGCDYVARSFSGDVKQLVTLLKGAVLHLGMAVIDVVSPCITFNNHEGSTKSLKFAREHEEKLHEIGYMDYRQEIHVEYGAGMTTIIDLPEGARLVLRKLARDHDPTNKYRALEILERATQERQLLTGLIYHNPRPAPTLGRQINLMEEPLATLPQQKVQPRAEALEEIMQRFR